MLLFPRQVALPESRIPVWDILRAFIQADIFVIGVGSVVLSRLKVVVSVGADPGN